MTKNKTIFVITKKRVTFDGFRLEGKRLMCTEAFFHSPINSTAPGIFKVSSLNDRVKTIDTEDIDQKMVMLPFEDSFVVMPLLHY